MITQSNGEPVQVSAIISTYNRAGYLVESIESLLKQTRPVDELIVVNDASEDDTADVLAQYGDRIKLVEHAKNRGKPAALNEMIPEARGSYVWIFDDDDVALPDALAQHLEFLVTHDDIDFTYSGSYHTVAGHPIWEHAYWQISPVPHVAPEALLVETMMAMYTLMQGMLIPRSALIDIGLFDESFDRCEDLDMLLRLAAKYRGGALPEPTYVYREHDGVRGALGHQHAGHDRVSVMMSYRRRIFKTVRERFALSCYLTRACRMDEPLTGKDEATALLQRGCIMLRQGLVDLGIADFDRAFAEPGFEEIDPVWRDALLSRACDPEPWVFDRPASTARKLVRLLESHGLLDLARALMRGGYWAFRRALAARQCKAAFQSARFVGEIQTAWLVARGRRRLL